MTSLWNRASQKTSIVSGVNWTLTHTPVCWTRDSLRERERKRGTGDKGGSERTSESKRDSDTKRKKKGGVKGGKGQPSTVAKSRMFSIKQL